MSAYLSRHRTFLTTAAWLRRITVALPAPHPAACWPGPPPSRPPPPRCSRPTISGTMSRAAATGSTARVITTGGMPGWQITLIVVAAALAAAAAAVLLDRTRPSRRSASSAG